MKEVTYADLASNWDWDKLQLYGLALYDLKFYYAYKSTAARSKNPQRFILLIWDIEPHTPKKFQVVEKSLICCPTPYSRTVRPKVCHIDKFGTGFFYSKTGCLQ